MYSYYDGRVTAINKFLSDEKDAIPTSSLVDLQQRIARTVDPELRNLYVLLAALYGFREACECTLRYISFLKEVRMYVETESGEMTALGDDGVLSHEVSQENLLDAMGADTKSMTSGHAKNIATGQKNLLAMSDFLSRPTIIQSTTIPIGSNTQLRLSVWDLFTRAPAIRAKLRNYAYLRGNLFVRVAVSGTPFHTGRLMLSYQPFPSVNQTLLTVLSNVAVNANYYANMIGYLSQAPGSCVMNLNENKPVTLKLPFLSTKPMHRLFNGGSTAAIPAATSFDDFVNAGDLFLWTTQFPGAVTASPSTLYLFVYAWMEDVELGTTTATQLVIQTESGKMDERRTGPVERVSSALAKAANSVSEVAIIGPYAKASSIILSGVSSLAAVFGWSKPSIIATPNFVKNEPFRNGAHTIGAETLKRITLDPMQEVTVDPRVLGSEEDEMTIAHLCRRVSYIASFNWSHSAAALQNPIWYARINPLLVSSVNDGTLTYNVPSGMAFAAAPFYYWRGDITFRFEFVASAFHRGKMAIFYEPNINQAAIINPMLQLNKNYMKIIDIQDTTTVEICVNWASYRAWLKVSPWFDAPLNCGTTLSLTDSVGWVNGYIGVVPFTALQSPDNSDIAVNVYCYSNNMNFNFFTGINFPTARTVPVASGELLVVESESGYITSEPTQEMTCLELNESTAMTDHLSQDYFGEQPYSFRALMKRYVSVEVITYSADTNLYKRIRGSYPIYPANSMPINAAFGARNDLFSYLRLAYLGVRGSARIRAHLTANPNISPNPTAHARVTLLAPTTTQTTAATSVGTSITHADFEGTVSFVPTTNGGVEAELPFYSNNLFVFPMADTFDDSGGSTDTMSLTWCRNFTVDFEGNGSTAVGYLSLDRAYGEDFSFLRFQGGVYYSTPVVT